MSIWHVPCAYAPEIKKRFHSQARARLRKLADMLGFAKGTYDLRSNKAGIAISGEVILHEATVYIQVSQSVLDRRLGVLIRRCKGRQDYEGGRNHFVPLAMLDDLPALADYVRRVLAEPGGEG